MSSTWPFWLTVCALYLHATWADICSLCCMILCPGCLICSIWGKKHFQHLVSSSSVCSLNWLQALLFLLVGFALFLRFARLQKPRIKLIVTFKYAVMTCDLALCKSHLLSWWILHERKATWEFYSLQYLLSLETSGKKEGRKSVIFVIFLLQNQILDRWILVLLLFNS